MHLLAVLDLKRRWMDLFGSGCIQQRHLAGRYSRMGVGRGVSLIIRPATAGSGFWHHLRCPDCCAHSYTDGDGHSHPDRDTHVYTDGDAHVYTDGDAYVYTDGDAYVYTDGDAYGNTDGDAYSAACIDACTPTGAIAYLVACADVDACAGIGCSANNRPGGNCSALSCSDSRGWRRDAANRRCGRATCRDGDDCACSCCRWRARTIAHLRAVCPLHTRSRSAARAIDNCDADEYAAAILYARAGRGSTCARGRAREPRRRIG